MNHTFFATREDAERYLATMPKTQDTHLDRIAAKRRILPLTTPEERAAVRAYNAERAAERAAVGRSVHESRENSRAPEIFTVSGNVAAPRARARLLLVDGANVVMRCAFGGDIPPSRAVPTATGMIERVARELQATHLIALLEGLSDVPSVRRQLYADYKSNRAGTDTRPWLRAAHAAWTAAGWAVQTAPGFEADDAIATTVHRLHAATALGPLVEAVILSGDSDLLALTTYPGVTIARPEQGSQVSRWGATEAALKFQLADAALLPAFKALAGEPGDGIPGPFGKRCAARARKLLAAHGSFAGVLAHAGLSDAERQIAERAWALVQLRTDAPLPAIGFADCALTPSSR